MTKKQQLRADLDHIIFGRYGERVEFDNGFAEHRIDSQICEEMLDELTDYCLELK